MIRLAGHGALVLILTALTQLGGVAWMLSRLLPRWRLPGFIALYALLSVGAVFVAPTFGRVALDCSDKGALQVQSWAYCGLNRQYVAPEMRAVLGDLAAHVEAAQPGTVTIVLDANFPFFNGFPLLPHLSHDDGEKVDIALYYADAQGYTPATRSPIGYFAFEQGPTRCTRTWLTLRWDMAWLQPLWRDLALEPARTSAAVAWLAADARVGKVFLEPHLVQRLGLSAPKVRFQGCRAARHDDHIHIQL